MEVTKGIRIRFVQYSKSGRVLIEACTVLKNADGDTVAILNGENVVTTQEALTARAGGKTWGDEHVEAEVQAATKIERTVERVSKTITTVIKAEGKPDETLSQNVDGEQPVERQVPRFADVAFIEWE